LVAEENSKHRENDDFNQASLPGFHFFVCHFKKVFISRIIISQALFSQSPSNTIQRRGRICRVNRLQFMFWIPGALTAAVMSAERNSHGMVQHVLPVRPAIQKMSGPRKNRFFLKPVLPISLLPHNQHRNANFFSKNAFTYLSANCSPV
jgi:hypothetical protein